MSGLEGLPNVLRELYNTLEPGREYSIREVAEMRGVKESTARKYLDTLARRGLIEKTPRGTYVRPSPPQEEEPPREAEEEKREPAATVEPTAGPGREEALEVKPGAEVREPLYFYYRGSVVPLRARSLEQLEAILRYRLVEPEELAYMVRTGFLQSWVERSLHNRELAERLEELRGLSEPELYERAVKLFTGKP